MVATNHMWPSSYLNGGEAGKETFRALSDMIVHLNNERQHKERFHENWIFLVFGRYFGLPCFTFWSTTGLPWTTPDFYYLLS